MNDHPQSPPKRVALLTSGGDAPGMNAAIRAASMLLLTRGIEVFGVQQGYRGLLHGDFVPLGPGEVGGILREGGTVLGSARCLEFHAQQGRNQARAHLHQAGIEGLIVIGGNGSLTGARYLGDPEELGEQKLGVIGVPASIDNDIGLTGMAIGVDTAMNTITEACDRIADTASAHNRTFLVEVMGRDCGYLAMTSAIASGADAVLFREAGKDNTEAVETVLRAVKRAQQRPNSQRRVLVIKAEGGDFPIQQLKENIDHHLRQEMPEQPVETRITVLGHVVRGGRPTAFDRLLASRLARVAVESLLQGQTLKMAAWLQAAPMPSDQSQRSRSDPYCWLVDLDAVLTETRNLLSGESPLVQWRKQVFEQLEDVLAYESS